MFSAKNVIYLTASVVLATSQTALAVQGTEADSAYRWGRWAVLSPAAGGAEPYVAVAAPGVVYNSRPGDASQFQPEVANIEGPIDDPRDRLPPPPPPPVADDPRDRLPPR